MSNPFPLVMRIDFKLRKLIRIMWRIGLFLKFIIFRPQDDGYRNMNRIKVAVCEAYWRSGLFFGMKSKSFMHKLCNSFPLSSLYKQIRYS